MPNHWRTSFGHFRHIIGYHSNSITCFQDSLILASSGYDLKTSYNVGDLHVLPGDSSQHVQM